MSETSWTLKQRRAFYCTTRKGYHLYNQKLSKIIHSNDVAFNELTQGYECEGEPQQTQLMEMENFTEEDTNKLESEGETGDNEGRGNVILQLFQSNKERLQGASPNPPSGGGGSPLSFEASGSSSKRSKKMYHNTWFLI